MTGLERRPQLARDSFALSGPGNSTRASFSTDPSWRGRERASCIFVCGDWCGPFPDDRVLQSQYRGQMDAAAGGFASVLRLKSWWPKRLHSPEGRENSFFSPCSSGEPAFIPSKPLLCNDLIDLTANRTIFSR